MSNLQYLSVLFSLPFIILFSACIREEVIDTIEIEQAVQPVVFCTLSPGDSIQLLLTQSTTFFDEPASVEELGIYDAKVSILNEKGDTLQLQNPKSQLPIYTASQKDFSIIAGETYHLLIQVLGNSELLSSSTTIPDKAVQWDNFEVYNEKVVDIPIRNNKYEIIGYKKETYMDVKGVWSNQSYATELMSYSISSLDSIMYVNVNHQVSDLDYHIRVTSCCNYFQLEGINTSINQGDSLVISRSIRFDIITLNQNLEDFLLAYEVNHENKESIDMNLFLRLFKGVLPEYTNIKGGLGVFGGYLSDSNTI